MSGSNIRLERIQRLLKELEYEITRGVMDHEIEPEMSYNFVIPYGPAGRVRLEMRMRPIQRDEYYWVEPNKCTLRVIDGGAG